MADAVRVEPCGGLAFTAQVALVADAVRVEPRGGLAFLLEVALVADAVCVESGGALAFGAGVDGRYHQNCRGKESLEEAGAEHCRFVEEASGGVVGGFGVLKKET